MALNATTLAAAIKAKLLADCGAVDDTPLDEFCDAIAEAVVDHITANAVVSVTTDVQVRTDGGSFVGSSGIIS